MARLTCPAPDANNIVLAARERQSPVARESDKPDLIAMAFERSQWLARGRVPQPDRVVLAGRKDAATVRRKRDTVNVAFVAGEGADHLAGVQIQIGRAHV